MSDKYDEAIATLTEFPDMIRPSWENPCDYQTGCLFEFTDTGTIYDGCGCLTQVRAGTDPAPTVELTIAIRGDRRIPCLLKDITVNDLPVFAEWQRRLDRELNRV